MADDQQTNQNSRKHKHSPDTWAELIHENTIKELLKLKNKEIVTLKGHLTIRQALEILEKNEILSAPVLNEQNQFQGFVDVLDLAGYTLLSWNKLSNSFTAPKKRDYAREEFFQTPLNQLINFSGVDPSIFVYETDSIAHLIGIFCQHKLHSRLHRVAVLDEKNLLKNIISQSDVIRYAQLHSELFPEIKLKDIESFHTPISVRLDTPFYSTLEVLYRNRISGIALIDDQARLSGCFSASDLRGMTTKSFSFFTGSTLQFLSKGTTSKIPAPVTCSAETNLTEALNKMVEHKVHRLFVTESSSHPLGVLTMSEILQILNVEHHKKHKH